MTNVRTQAAAIDQTINQEILFARLCSAGVGWMILRDVCVLAAIGVAISVPAALVASRAVQVYLFGVEASDPSTFVAAVIVLTMAAMAAGYGPAYRASRVNPMTALRAD